MIIEGVMWGLLGGLLASLFVMVYCVVAVCGKDWRDYPVLFFGLLSDSTSGVWKTILVLLTVFLSYGLVFGAVLQGGLPRLIAFFAIMIYSISIVVFYTGMCVIHSGWKITLWPAAWRYIDQPGTPSYQSKKRITCRLFFASIAISLVYGYLGLYDSLL